MVSLLEERLQEVGYYNDDLDVAIVETVLGAGVSLEDVVVYRRVQSGGSKDIVIIRKPAVGDEYFLVIYIRSRHSVTDSMVGKFDSDTAQPINEDAYRMVN